MVKIINSDLPIEILKSNIHNQLKRLLYKINCSIEQFGEYYDKQPIDFFEEKSDDWKKAFMLYHYSIFLESITEIIISRHGLEKIFPEIKLNQSKSFEKNIFLFDQEIDNSTFNINLKYDKIAVMIEDLEDYTPAIFTFSKLNQKLKKNNKIYPIYKFSFWNVKIHSPALTFYISEAKIPRIYIDCFAYNKCEKKVFGELTANCEFINDELSLNFKESFCMKTPRTYQNCLDYLNTKSTTICFVILSIFHNLGEYLNKDAKIKDKPEKTNKKTNKETNNKKYKPFIRINNNYKYKENINKSTGSGSPKSPHWRIGHTRTLKNGKRIEVKSCYINKNKNKEKKPYRI